MRENFEKTLSIDPSNPEAYLGLGGAYSALGEHQQAVAALTKALECPRVPNHVLFHIYRLRGQIYDLQNNYAAALSDYDRAIEMVAYQWWLYKRRGRAHFYLKHYEQALADIAKGLEHQPDDESNLTWIPFEHVASCPDEKFRTGMFALADKTIKILKSKPDTPDNAKYHNSLAWLLATWMVPKSSDLGQAVAHAKKAVELAPDNGSHWSTLGVAQYRTGDWKAAVEALMKSVQLRKRGNSFVFFFLAMAHWQLGEKEKARAWYDRGVAWMDKNNPSNEELRRFRAEATALLGPAQATQTQNKKD